MQRYTYCVCLSVYISVQTDRHTHTEFLSIVTNVSISLLPQLVTHSQETEYFIIQIYICTQVEYSLQLKCSEQEFLRLQVWNIDFTD